MFCMFKKAWAYEEGCTSSCYHSLPKEQGGRRK